jgi:hypothetical protein
MFFHQYLWRGRALPAIVSFKAIRITDHEWHLGDSSGGQCPPYRLAAVSYHGKEVACTFGIGPAIVRHVFSSIFMEGAGLARHRVIQSHPHYRS